MYKIQASCEYNLHPKQKDEKVFREHITRDLVTSFAKKMYENDCIAIEERNLKPINPHVPSRVALYARGYIMTPDEFTELCHTISFLENYGGGGHLRPAIEKLKEIVLNEPKKK